MKIMYVCEPCYFGAPEDCGHFDRRDLRVQADGKWVCEACYDDPAWTSLTPPPEYVPSAIEQPQAAPAPKEG